MKGTKSGVLLAYFEKGCNSICTKVHQMPMFLPYPKTTISKTNGDIHPLAVCQVENRPHSPLPKGRGNASFAIVAIDYFTKWVEAESLTKITEVNTSKFSWKNIICRFETLHSTVLDNGRQFDNKRSEIYVRNWESISISQHHIIPS